MKKWAVWLLIGLLAFSGCSKETPPEPTKTSLEETEPKESPFQLSIATSANLDSFSGRLIQEKAKEWNLASKGQVKVDFYGNGSLGDDETLIQAVSRGTVSIVMMDPSLYTPVVPEAVFFAVPLLYPTLEEYNDFFCGGFRGKMEGYFEEAGLKLLDCQATGWKYLTSTVPLVSQSDFSKLNLRVVNNPYRQSFWNACGISCGMLPFSDLFMALKDGTFNAQENSLETIVAGRFWEVQKYLIDTRHLPTFRSFVMNREAYEALPEDVKEGLLAFLKDISESYQNERPGLEEQFLQKLLEEGGMEYQEASDAALALMQEGKIAFLNRLKETVGEEAVNEFLKKVENG
ncbi:TRAP transporter substrate-binding protein [Hominifimenecus sp. rT4P-3]|uniref:TRAP transporter substrate-binding protein n=1 Tax=Hominifimenecus sp. rT4P-3 TaxID=3242979 RepID=UPI003DA53DF4